MKLLLKRLLSLLPTRLPVGMTEFNAWLDSILELTGPIADDISLKWVISNEVMRIQSGKDKVAKHYFVRTLRKYAANQLAAATVNLLKEQQDQLIKAAKEKTALEEATPKEIDIQP